MGGALWKLSILTVFWVSPWTSFIFSTSITIFSLLLHVELLCWDFAFRTEFQHFVLKLNNFFFYFTDITKREIRGWKEAQRQGEKKVNLQISVVYQKLIFFPLVANQKEFFGEGFKGDKTFIFIILLAKKVYQLVDFNKKCTSPFIALTTSLSCECGAQLNTFIVPLKNAHVGPFSLSTLLTLQLFMLRPPNLPHSPTCMKFPYRASCPTCGHQFTFWVLVCHHCSY